MNSIRRSGLRIVAHFRFYSLLLLPFALGINIVHAGGGAPAYLRFAHLAPGATAFLVRVQQQPAIPRPLAYPEISDWFSLEPETVELRVESIDNGFRLNHVLQAEAGNWYTVVLIADRTTDALRIHVAEEPVGGIPAGESRIGVLNTLNKAGPIDLYANDSALLQQVTLPQQNGRTPSVDVIANIYELALRNHNESSRSVGDPRITSLLPETYYLLALTGTTENPLILITATTNQPSTEMPPLLPVEPPLEVVAHLRLAHFASGLGGVDLHINGERSAVQGLTFPEVSAFVELPPNETTIAVVVETGADSIERLASQTIRLDPHDWYTVALIGSVENDTLQLQPLLEDFSSLEANQTRIGVFQSVPGIPPLDVLDGSDMTLVRLLGYPGSQGGNDGYETVDLPVMTTRIRFVSAADPQDVLAALPELAYTEGRHYLIATLLADPPYTIVVHELLNENGP